MEKELILKLRSALNLTKQDISDQDLFNLCKDSFLIKGLELGIALNRFKKDLLDAIIFWK